MEQESKKSITIVYEKIRQFSKILIGERGALKDYENSKIVTFIMGLLSALVLYFFYLLGYAFLYGYYFSGGYDYSVSYFNIFINPVPFPFKATITIGIFLLVHAIILLLPMLRVLFYKKLLKSLPGLLIGVIGINFLLALSYSLIFTGADELFQIFRPFMELTVFPVTIFIVLLWFRNSIVGEKAFLLCVLWLVQLDLILFFVFKIDPFFYVSIFFISVFFFSHILWGITIQVKEFLYRKLNTQKYIQIRNLFVNLHWYLWTFLIVGFFIILILKSLGMAVRYRNVLAIFMAVPLSNVSVRTSFSFIEKRKSEITMNVPTDTSKEQNNDLFSTKNTIFISFIAGSVLILYTLAMTPHLVASTAKRVRISLYNVKKEQIIYTNSKNEEITIEGNLVAQQNGTYYISRYPDRKLVMIKSNEVIVMPDEAFLEE